MTEDPTDKAFKELESRISAIRGKHEESDGGKKTQPNLSLGMRAVVDLISGVAVGTGIGYALDVWFQTLPLMMLICMVLGLGGGIRLLLETAKEAEKSAQEDKETS